MIIFKDKKSFLSILSIIFLSFVLSISVEKFQYALDGGYVLSGLVEYPNNSPMKYYYLNSWTSLHQITAILLKLGFNGNIISIFILFISAVSYALGVFFISRVITGSNIFPLLLTFSFLILGKNFGDTDYPSLVFSEHSFGMIGFALCTLILGLYANNNIFISSLLLGFLMCVHPIIGFWMMMFFFIVLFLNKKQFIDRDIVYGISSGLLLSLLSFYFYNLFSISYGETNNQLYNIFVENWDGHRNTESGLHYLYLFKSFLLLALLVIFKNFKIKDSPRSLKIFLNYLLILISSAMIFYISYKIFPVVFPDIFIKIMPSRFLMIYSVLGWPIIISIIYFIIMNKFIVKKNFLNIILCLIIVIPIFQKNEKIISIFKNINFNYEKENNTIYNEIKNLKTTGHFLSTSSLNYDLLRKSNKPFLFDTNSFDFIPYHSHLIDDLDMIFKDFFNIDIKVKTKIKNSSLSDTLIKESYENKDYANWKNLFKKHNINYLVVPANWKINLELINTNNIISVYSVKN